VCGMYAAITLLKVLTLLRYFILKDSNKINDDEIIKHVTRRIIERVLLGLHKKDKYKIVLHILKQVYDNLIPDAVRNVSLK
jgi:hypothetical protein